MPWWSSYLKVVGAEPNGALPSHASASSVAPGGVTEVPVGSAVAEVSGRDFSPSVQANQPSGSVTPATSAGDGSHTPPLAGATPLASSSSSAAAAASQEPAPVGGGGGASAAPAAISEEEEMMQDLRQQRSVQERLDVQGATAIKKEIVRYEEQKQFLNQLKGRH